MNEGSGARQSEPSAVSGEPGTAAAGEAPDLLLAPPEPHAACLPSRACAWCTSPIVVLPRPGRPRLYCRQICRQRAYEHRHGFVHVRSQRLLPGQLAERERPGRPRVRGSGYERGGSGLGRTRTHALRHSVRPEGYRRETVCGALAVPMEGQHFLPLAANACQTCATVVALAPLAAPIQPSNELSLLRALIEETREQRLAPDAAVAWLQQHGPPRPAARPAA